MESLHQDIQVSFHYDVHFTENVFARDNDVLGAAIEANADPAPHRVVLAVDDGLVKHYPGLIDDIQAYFHDRPSIELAHAPLLLPGGEAAKNDPTLVDTLHAALYDARLCRHSYVVVVGGGSVIDLAGFAAATAHRGVRLIRIPTTVLSQNDSAVGVKNGINAFHSKNFIGTFAPPVAVINDSRFLETLDDRDWRAGIPEAVKVALLKSPSFFEEVERNAGLLSPSVRDMDAMRRLIHRSARLHLEHIGTSGDPFEMGTSRPLDFGHWSAHQLEQLTAYELRHGEAVAIGIALDTTYSYLQGMLDRESWQRTLHLFETVGLDLYVPELDEHLDDPNHPRCIFRGLEAFREHLGGELTIMMLEEIGRGVDVHEVELDTFRRAIDMLRKRQPATSNVS